MPNERRCYHGEDRLLKKCILVQKLVPTLTFFSRLSQACPFYHSVSVRLAPPAPALASFHELQPESSHAFMNAFLDSQMFERFLEERTANPTQPEVRFFDESIAAKLNRSKTNPIKRDTPFLNDLSDAHNQASRGGGRGGGDGGIFHFFFRVAVIAVAHDWPRLSSGGRAGGRGWDACDNACHSHIDR